MRSDVEPGPVPDHPTVLEMLGLRPAEGQRFDGISIVPALRGGALPRREIFCYFPHYVPASDNLPATWVRRGDWKLIRFFADGPGGADRHELYHLKADPGETKDLAGEKPELVRELGALIDRHHAEIGALIPRPNPSWRERPPGERAGVEGWIASADAAISAVDGALAIEATGGDPWISTRGVPAGRGPYTLELEMRSTGAGRGQVFWGGDGRPRFHRDRSVPFDIVHDGGWHACSVGLPVATGIDALRIDPGTAPGAIAIRGLRLLDGDRKVLKRWEFSGDGAPGE